MCSITFRMISKDLSTNHKESPRDDTDLNNPCQLHIVDNMNLLCRECFHGIWNEYFTSRIRYFSKFVLNYIFPSFAFIIL